MPRNKKHHYVPKFYLKRFSSDERSICLWNISTKKKVLHVPLKNQCYKDYHYGKDAEFEKCLSEMEGDAALLFREIDYKYQLPPLKSKGHVFLLIYMLFQYCRTTFLPNEVEKTIDACYKHIFRDHPKLAGIDLNNFKITMSNNVQHAIGSGISSYPILLDMHYKLLCNRTNIEFVTSDNPVVKCNQLFSRLPSRAKFGSNTGFAMKGLQIFFPISTDKVLLFYDSDAYTLSPKNKMSIQVTNPRDVYQINALQICSAVKTVYFKKSEFNVEKLHERFQNFRKSMNMKLTEFPIRETANMKDELICLSHQDIETNLTLSFIKSTRKSKIWINSRMNKGGKMIDELRNKKLHDIYQEFLNEVENQQYQAGDFFQFISDKNDSVW